MKIFKRFKKELKEIDTFNTYNNEAGRKEATIKKIVVYLLKNDFDDLYICRQLGFSSNEEWEWLRNVRKEYEQNVH